jgi:hypothetical protein
MTSQKVKRNFLFVVSRKVLCLFGFHKWSKPDTGGSGHGSLNSNCLYCKRSKIKLPVINRDLSTGPSVSQRSDKKEEAKDQEQDETMTAEEWYNMLGNDVNMRR